MDILDLALQKEGGVSKLADALGCRQNVISNWRSRRLPKPWRMVLEMKYGPNEANPSAARPSAATESVANPAA